MDTATKIKKGRIKSLEGLRAFAFLCVVFNHTHLAKDTFTCVGNMAVSLFFVLSGFVLVYSSIDKTNFEPSISYNFKYLVKRLKKLYPLFVLTTLVFIPFEFVGEVIEPLSNTVVRLVLNIMLIQEWFPLRLRSFNGVAWFLCTLALFYFVFPYILKRIQKCYSKKTAIARIVLLILLEALFAVVSLFLPRPAYVEGMTLEYDIAKWFVYRFPLTRIIDCLIGCNLGYLFICNKDKKICYATLKEVVALVLCLITSVIASKVNPITPLNALVPSVDYTIGWSRALLFLPGTISIIYLFAYNQGKISKVFENKFFMYLANLSPYGFLIHNVIFIYISKASCYLIGKEFDELYSGYINITIGFFLTLVACQIWIWVTNLMTKKKQTL